MTHHMTGGFLMARGPNETVPSQFRLSRADLAKLDELAAKLGPVPLTRVQVLRLAISRLYASETKRSKRTTKTGEMR